MRSLVSRLRRREDERVAAARAAHAAGRFAEARRTVAPVIEEGNASLEVVRGMAELEYLLGDYVTSEMLLHQVVARAGKDVETRADAEGALALVYLQTNRYAETHDLFAGIEGAVTLPIWDLMRSFGDTPPYRVEWPGGYAAVAPFLQDADWQLPASRSRSTDARSRPRSTRAATSSRSTPRPPRRSASCPWRRSQARSRTGLPARWDTGG